jgi:hypothetical protein
MTWDSSLTFQKGADVPTGEKAGPLFRFYNSRNYLEEVT